MILQKLGLFLLLCLTQHGCNATVNFLTKNVSHPHRTITFDQRTFKDPRLLYAVCDESSTAKTCQVIREKSPFQNHIDNCTITLRAKKNNGHIDNHMRIVPFSKDKAIVAWVEKTDSDTLLGLTAIRFRDCSVHQLSYPFDYKVEGGSSLHSLVSFVTYENSYDVVFVSSKVCTNKYCKMTIDVQTNRIQGPDSWFPIKSENAYIDLMALGTMRSEYLVFQYGSGKANLGVISEYEHDTTTLLPYECRHYVTPCTYAYTNTNNHIGSCSLIHENLGCVQFNQSSGLITFHSGILVGDEIVSAVHNLPAGGMLVLLDRYREGDYEVLQLNPQGKYNGSLYFSHESEDRKNESSEGNRQVHSVDVKFKCNRDKYATTAQFYEDNEQYCASVACYENTYVPYKSDYDGYLAVNAYCFTLDDFVVKQTKEETTVTSDDAQTNQTMVSPN